MRIHVAWLALVAVLALLCFTWQDTARLVLAVNTKLQGHIEEMQNAPHPVHDAELTAFTEPDGSILIVVNGRFPHRVYSMCSDKRAF